MKKIYLLLFTILMTSLSFGQTTGDIAFIGVNVDGGDDLAIVALADIAANTTIYITDNEVNGLALADTNEGELTWDTGASIITAGTVVVFTDISTGTSSTVSHGAITAGSSFNLSASGDAVFMFLGTDPSTPTVFLAGVQNEANNQGTLAGSGLTDGSTFFTFTTSGNPDGGAYSGSRNSEVAFADYIALISNPSNWTLQNSNGELVLPFDTTAFVESAVATPTITVGASVTGLDYFEGFGPSTEGTFTVAGNNLTADIDVAAPVNFEISLTSGSGFTTGSVQVSQVGGTVSTTTIYTRLIAGLSANSYTDDVIASSSGATNQTVNLSGTVTPATPLITISGSTASLDYNEGFGPSPEDSFTVEGIFLTTDITVAAPTNFEISTVSGSGFGSSVILTPISGDVATTTIYVRLASGLSAANYSGNITASSTGATDKTLALVGDVFGALTNALTITGVYDGPLTGGTPKGVELYVIADIADLSLFGIGSANNGGGTDGEEFTFPPVSATAGDYIYVTNSTNFTSFFGFAADYVDGSMGINGDDAVELFENGSVIDLFGDINTDGTGTAWDFLDGWAYRNTPGPSATFNDIEWDFSGINQLEGGTTNATTTVPFPIATYYNTVLTVETNQIDGFSVYPNPIKEGYLTINSANSSIKSIEIYDVLGKQVLSTSVQNNERINISTLNSGIYILRVEEEGKLATRKLIIQ